MQLSTREAFVWTKRSFLFLIFFWVNGPITCLTTNKDLFYDRPKGGFVQKKCKDKEVYEKEKIAYNILLRNKAGKDMVLKSEFDDAEKTITQLYKSPTTGKKFPNMNQYLVKKEGLYNSELHLNIQALCFLDELFYAFHSCDFDYGGADIDHGTFPSDMVEIEKDVWKLVDFDCALRKTDKKRLTLKQFMKEAEQEYTIIVCHGQKGVIENTLRKKEKKRGQPYYFARSMIEKGGIEKGRIEKKKIKRSKPLLNKIYYDLTVRYKDNSLCKFYKDQEVVHEGGIKLPRLEKQLAAYTNSSEIQIFAHNLGSNKRFVLPKTLRGLVQGGAIPGWELKLIRNRKRIWYTATKEKKNTQFTIILNEMPKSSSIDHNNNHLNRGVNLKKETPIYQRSWFYGFITLGVSLAVVFTIYCLGFKKQKTKKKIVTQEKEVEEKSFRGK